MKIIASLLHHAGCLALFAIAVLAAPHAYAGAWLQPHGKGLLITQANYYSTSAYFDAQGTLQSQARFTKYEFQPYAEYGLSETLTLGGSAYAQYVTQSGANNQGLADPEFFLRARIWHDDQQVLSLQPLLKASRYYPSNRPPRGGSETTDMELSLLYGRAQPLLTANDYIDLRAGYRARNQGLSDQLRLDALVGLKLNDHIEMMPALRMIMATQPTDASIYRENGELDYSILKAEISGMYHLNTQQSLQAAVSRPLMGMQTGAGYGISLGFAQTF